MDFVRKGQLIAIVCLTITVGLLTFLPGRMVLLRYVAIFALVLSAINVVLSRVIPAPSSQLGQRLVLFASISIACLVVGALLLRVIMTVGLLLVGASLLLNWFVIRPLQTRLRNPDAR